MKNLTITLFALLLAFFVTEGCDKFADPANNGKIVATKIDVKINEPDSLVLVGAKSTDSVRWSVSPAGFNGIIANKGAARLVFTKSGSYTVSASNNGAVPATIVIKVEQDSISTADTTKLVPLTGDNIALHPSYYQSAAGDSVGIGFNAVTTNLYCSNGLLKSHTTLDANKNFGIDFLDVQEPKVCRSTTDIPMAAGVNFPRTYLANGSYPLKVTLNGTTYTGNIIISATTISFDWNYTAGVVISPKQMNRQ